VKTGYVSEIFVSFQGEGVYAGRRHLFIRMAGCNLRCRYCDTPDSLERVPGFTVHGSGGTTQLFPNPVSSRDLFQYAEPLLVDGESIDGTALTGGEPLLQADFLAEVLVSAPLPKPVLLETSGVLPERLRTVLPYIDVVSMHLKIPSNTGEPEFWEAHRQFLSLASDKAYVKILVDTHSTEADLMTAADLVRTTAPQVPVFIQPITDPQGRVRIDELALHRSFAIVRGYLDDVRVLPQTHKMLGIL
jgi:organic radical activating enzyme